jgi:signal transduction histidine kinase
VLRRLPLTVKLSLVVAVAAALATASVAGVVLLATRAGFGQYLTSQVTERTAELRPELEQYYAREGSWQGVDALMAEPNQAGAPGWGGHHGRMGPGTTSLVLVDSAGAVQYAPPEVGPLANVAWRLRREAVPLSVDGKVVGYLMAQAGVQETNFSDRLLATILRTGAIAVVLALAVGLVLTRHALRPLSELEAATERISAGELSVRVPVHSHDEVGALAVRFNGMAAQLQEQDALRKRLMNDIAHELRTPLTVMQGQIEALQDGVFPLSAENLEPVHGETLLLARLVSDLRDLSLAEAGQLALDLAPLELNGLLQRVGARFASQAQAAHIYLQVLEAEAPLVTVADAQRLEQVLGNLLSNALRHTPEGGTVSLEAQARLGGARLTVRDSGSGIPAEDLPHVFERFYRGDPARAHRDGHTGLGLAIARELIRAHGGEITASSAPGKGTAFTIDLPGAPSEAAATL